MIERFKYHALTSGLSGRITLPFDAAIPEQASVTLPDDGGYVSARVDNFNFRDLITFDRAYSFAAGSFSEKNKAFDATCAVTIEGLNIFNVITADRIVARISSSHPKNGDEPFIAPIGSSFENFRVAGRKIEMDLAIDTFTEFGTASGFRAACANTDLNGSVEQHVLGTSPNGEILCTLVRGIEGGGKEIGIDGHVITIRDFGVVRIGELTIGDRKRKVAMIQFELGSTPSGSGQSGGAEGNGDGN